MLGGPHLVLADADGDDRVAVRASARHSSWMAYCAEIDWYVLVVT